MSPRCSPQDDRVTHVIRFRHGSYGVVADVEKNIRNFWFPAPPRGTTCLLRGDPPRIAWVVCRRVGEFCRAAASVASVMSVLASRRGGLTELTLTGAFTLPNIPPLSVNSPNQTFHPSGAVYRIGESLGIVSFVRIGKPKWFVWGRWRVHLAQQQSNHWLTFNLFITRYWVKNRMPRVFGGSIKIRAQLSCEY